MAWELSSSGFLMTLSSYIPDLLEEDFSQFSGRALAKAGLNQKDITHWCIHPGGKKILEAIHKTLSLQNGELQASWDVLQQYGNMSSPTILFVLKKMMPSLLHNHNRKEHIFGAAFGPGLTMETFTASVNS
jgi:predicted naringenin-chalcone synthase